MSEYVTKLKFHHFSPSSYVSKVAEPGLYGQRQNPEFKVRSMDPRVVEVKERLEHFNQVRSPHHNLLLPQPFLHFKRLKLISLCFCNCVFIWFKSSANITHSGILAISPFCVCCVWRQISKMNKKDGEKKSELMWKPKKKGKRKMRGRSKRSRMSDT